MIPSPSDTFLQGQHSKYSRLAKAQLHVQADFSTDIARNTVRNVSKAASFHRGLGHLFSQLSKPALCHLPARQHKISAMGHQYTRSISNAQIITPIPSQICFYLLNISVSSLCVQGFQLRPLRPVQIPTSSRYWLCIGSALGTCQKGVAGARLEPMAEMAEFFKFQPHWTKIALVCRFKAMSPPSHSVLDMFGVGLHQKWSPCPRNYSSSLKGAEESEYVQIG